MSVSLCIEGLGVERSPFYSCYATPESEFGVYNGRLFPWRLGESATDHYWRLRRHAVLFDVPERPLEISGPDAQRLLDTVLTRDVSRLRPDRAAYGIACLDDGGILMDGVVMRLAGDRFWYVQANGEFLPWLLAHGAGMDVSVRDPGSWVLQVQGPASLDILEAACDEGAPEAFRYFDVRECRIAGRPYLVSRTGWTGELGFEVYTLENEPAETPLWRTLMAAGESHGLVASSLRCMQIRRIEAGILDYGTEIDRSVTPFAAGLGRFVHLDKGDFIGRAALAEANRGQTLWGLKSPGGVPLTGSAISEDGRAVGRVLSSTFSPSLECGIAYVRFEHPGEWAGRRVDADIGSAGPETAEIVPLPFYDADKRIPRGLPWDGP